MLYDLHIHTREYSACSNSSAEEFCLTAIDRGLSGIALTEHDLWWPRKKIKKLRKKFQELTIMRGVEHSSPDGHFLLFLPDPDNSTIPRYCPAHILIPTVRDQGGITIWAHPFRWHGDVPYWLEVVQPDGMEVASSNMDSKAQAMARAYAETHNIMMFQNTDAHHHRALGKFVNDFPKEFKRVENFIRFVRERNR